MRRCEVLPCRGRPAFVIGWRAARHATVHVFEFAIAKPAGAQRGGRQRIDGIAAFHARIQLRTRVAGDARYGWRLTAGRTAARVAAWRGGAAGIVQRTGGCSNRGRNVGRRLYVRLVAFHPHCVPVSRCMSPSALPQLRAGAF